MCRSLFSDPSDCRNSTELFFNDAIAKVVYESNVTKIGPLSETLKPPVSKSVQCDLTIDDQGRVAKKHVIPSQRGRVCAQGVGIAILYIPLCTCPREADVMSCNASFLRYQIDAWPEGSRIVVDSLYSSSLFRCEIDLDGNGRVLRAKVVSDLLP